LAGVVQPGDTVVFKSNFVRDRRDTRATDGDCLVVPGSIVGAISSRTTRCDDASGGACSSSSSASFRTWDPWPVGPGTEACRR